MGNILNRNKRHNSKSIKSKNTINVDTLDLFSLNPDEIPLVPNKGLITKARVCSIYDGDTITCIFIHKFKDIGIPIKLNIRILGVDCPEIKSNNPIESNAAELVRDHLARMIFEKDVDIIIEKWDKYGGRALANVYYNNINISQYLIENNMGKQYNGNKKTTWTNDELNKITYISQ